MDAEKMKIVDLSHTISPEMPVYPGTEPPTFTAECTLDNVGFIEKKITLYSHTGTHMDAPAHIIRGARTLDQFSADHFMGKSSVLDMTSTHRPTVDIHHIEPYQDLIAKSKFLLLYTGWSRWWGTDAYYQGYPVLSPEAARWIAGFELRGLGVDMISVDPAGASPFTIHEIFLHRNILIIENLTNLQALPNTDFILSCFPLNIEDADGSPIRAVAIIE